MSIVQNLLAGLANGQLSRKDGRGWSAEDFGAKPMPKKKPKRVKITPEEFQRRAIAGWGPDGKGRKLHVVESLKGIGQPIPKVG